MRILTSGAVVLLLAGCSGELSPQAGVQGTIQPDCDAAVKPTGTVGVTIGKNGLTPRAGLGLNIDLLKLGKSRDTAADCAKAGLKTGANANVGISIGG